MDAFHQNDTSSLLHVMRKCGLEHIARGLSIFGHYCAESELDNLLTVQYSYNPGIYTPTKYGALNYCHYP